MALSGTYPTGSLLSAGSLSASPEAVQRVKPLGDMFALDQIQREVRANSRTLDQIQDAIQQCQDNVKAFTEQESLRMEEAFKNHIAAALPAAALYFLKCQEDKQLGREMPLPPEALAVTKPDATEADHETPIKVKDFKLEPGLAPVEGHRASTAKSLDSTTKSLVRDKFASTEQLEEKGLSSIQMNGDAPKKDLPEESTGVSEKRQHVVTTLQDTLWEISQIEKEETKHSWFTVAFERASTPTTTLQDQLIRMGFGFIIPEKRPNNFLTHIVEMPLFHLLSVFVIMTNTVWVGYESDQIIRMFCRQSNESIPEWFFKVENGFTIFFIVELAVRIAAYRAYFFVDKDRLRWNWLDVFVIVISVAQTGVDIPFLRLLRVFRLFRVLKVIVENKVFVELRNLLMAVVACLYPLFWASLFLAMVALMFALTILQCVASEIETVPPSHSISLLDDISLHLYGMEGCLKTLFIAVCGDDWLVLHTLLIGLESGSGVTAIIMPLFVVFVNIGVLNIVIGVFADASAGSKDRHSIAEEEIRGLESIAGDMLELVADYVTEDGTIEWEQFKNYFYREDVQAYLAYHGLDASHAQLIYKLFDSSKDGFVNVNEFVIGMLRLRGDAKRLDQRVELHAMQALLYQSDQTRKFEIELSNTEHFEV